MVKTYLIALPLIAVLIVSVIAGAYYYYEFGQASQSGNEYASELKTATADYNRLAANYNSSLSLTNKTLSLLVDAIEPLNTSDPAYANVSAELSELWAQYLALKPAEQAVYAPHILIDFGNGTEQWYNTTQVQPGWNLYVATVLIAKGNLQAQWYPAGSFGPGTPGEHFVTGIDGVSNTATTYWWIWTYNGTASWQVANAGADLYQVYNGSLFAWTYCGSTTTGEPTCSP